MVNGPLTPWRYKPTDGAKSGAAKGCDVTSANSDNNEILMGLAVHPGADMTARLLLALTALYAAKSTHSSEGQRQYVELALRLLDRVDATTRATVAGMLRGHRAVPDEICERLGLPKSARAESVEDASAPPRAIPAPAADAPAAPHAVVDPAALGEAFFAAPAAERRRLVALLPADPDADMAGVPTAEDAERFYAGLDAAALQGRIGEFIREFERRLAVPRSLCERIVNDRSGEPMVIAAKAANIPIAVLQRLLLLVNPAVSHSVQRVFDLTDFYHDIDRGTAVRLLSLWRADAKAEAKPDAAPAFPESAERRPPGDPPAGLRARFGALTERVQGLSSRPDQGSAARRDLRSR
jgi:hypothetical protein